MENADNKYCSCLYYSVNALSRILTKVADEAFSKVGLSSSYAFLLMTVSEKPGIQPKEISKKLQLTPSTITRLIEKMEYRGFLERKQSGRCTQVYATEAGLALHPKIKDAWQQLYQHYADVLGAEESNQLTADIYDAVTKLE